MGVESSQLSGKDLGNINDLILRSFGIAEAEDRLLILNSLQTLMSQMDPNANAEEAVQTEDRQCILCMDATANMMFMPCNHIAVCESCSDENGTFETCVFCGNAFESL